jgi:hypothetical protein
VLRLAGRRAKVTYTRGGAAGRSVRWPPISGSICSCCAPGCSPVRAVLGERTRSSSESSDLLSNGILTGRGRGLRYRPGRDPRPSASGTARGRTWCSVRAGARRRSPLWVWWGRRGVDPPDAPPMRDRAARRGRRERPEAPRTASGIEVGLWSSSSSARPGQAGDALFGSGPAPPLAVMTARQRAIRRRRGPESPQAASTPAGGGRVRRPPAVAATSRCACPRAGRPRPACRYGRVAEDAEDVVAELERLAQAAARSRSRRAHVSPAPASAAPSSSGRSTVYFADLYRATGWPGAPTSRRSPARGTSRYCPAVTSVRISSNTAGPGAAAGVERRCRAAARRTRPGTGRRAGSPPRRRTPRIAAPPSAGAVRAKRRCARRLAAGCTEAVHHVVVDQRARLHQFSERQAATRRPSGFVRRRRPAGSPSTRTPAAAACRCPSSRTRAASSTGAQRRRGRSRRAARPAG